MGGKAGGITSFRAGGHSETLKWIKDGEREREREKPPEDKGVYRFLGRKDCIFSSPFSARIIQEVIISPSVSPHPFYSIHEHRLPPTGLHIRIIIRHDQVYAISRWYSRERWRFIGLFLGMCAFQKRYSNIAILLPIIPFYSLLFSKIELSLQVQR